MGQSLRDSSSDLAFRSVPLILTSWRVLPLFLPSLFHRFDHPGNPGVNDVEKILQHVHYRDSIVITRQDPVTRSRCFNHDDNR